MPAPPSCPVLSAASRSHTSAPRTSPDDEPVRPHPQGLADQVAQRHPARALDVRGARHEPDDVRVPGPQLLGVLDQDDPLPRVDLAEQGVEQRRLPGARAAGHEQRQPGGEHRPQEGLAGGVQGAAGAQGGEVVGRGPQHAQRQARAVGGDRCEDRVQPHPGVGEPAVDARARVVEAAARRQREPLGQPAHRRLVGEADAGSLEPGAPVDPDRAAAADEDVRGARVAQQLVERAGPDELLAEHPQRGEHVEVRRHAAGLRADGGRHRRRRGRAARGGEPGPHPVDEHRVDRRPLRR